MLYFLSTIAFLFGCSSETNEDGLPCIDVTKSYPEKEIILTDIANVSYLCINSDNEEFLYSSEISINCITSNTIVLLDNHSGKILFFSKDGNPRSQFNNKGQGPEEYLEPQKVLYDEEANEVFVYSFSNSEILVYSSAGEYKRKITIPSEIRATAFYFFDNESFFLYDATTKSAPDKRFIRISKADGKVLDYVKLPINETKLTVQVDGRELPTMTNPVFRTKNGFLLCNPTTDTVFLYDKNKVLSPIICKTPLVKNLDPMVIMNNCLDYGDYQFINIITIQFDPASEFLRPTKYLMRNKKTEEVFHQKISHPDYKGKTFIVHKARIYDEGVFFELELEELKQADRENKLNGKLKELVASLNEDEDNNVFMFVNFK